MTIESITQAIMNDPENAHFQEAGQRPLFSMPDTARILIIGQAPGIQAMESRIFWNDLSGKRLREWLGVDDATFYESGKFAILPMDFYYPGKGKTGDLPPRKDFARKWHSALIEQTPHIQLTLLIGQYSQSYYLGAQRQKNLTETVKHYHNYLPTYFPLVHPSPRNTIWLAKNPWFIDEVIPDLQKRVHAILASK